MLIKINKHHPYNAHRHDDENQPPSFFMDQEQNLCLKQPLLVAITTSPNHSRLAI